MIRVLLADDHQLVRSGLAALLAGSEDIEVVGTAANGAEAVDMARRFTPEVVLMDLVMPVMDGVEATRRLVADVPSAQVVVLTSFSDQERILAALDAGAIGYLLKDVDPAELVRGVRAAARGESPLHPKAARSLLSSRTESRPAERTNVELTPREAQVLNLLRQGLANKQIARSLGISQATVKAHLTSVFQRIGVTDRVQAAVWAERRASE
ncbi:MAG TPA: response regulator transcription factor [Frankiaceae bacterium]|jgi:DNA-binding NarL/FixJ family response regulator|nr:response regulator transcription factor [Frankiaceae bacterium]